MGLVCQSREGTSPIIRPTAALRLVFHRSGQSILGFRLTHICSHNLLWRKRIWVTDFSGGEGTEYLEKCQPYFVELYVIWGGTAKARDWSGDVDREKKVGVSWENNLVFAVSDSDAFDLWKFTAVVMKPSLTYASQLYSNPTNCHRSSHMYSVCGCGGVCNTKVVKFHYLLS